MNDLPLLELFTKLKEAGLPLGIDEYQAVLQALQVGFGVNDQAALKRLCQTVWIKSAEEKLLFDYHFAAMMNLKSPNSEVLPTPTKRDNFFLTRSLILGILSIGMSLGMVADQKLQTQQLITAIDSVQVPIPVPDPIQPNSTPSPTVKPTVAPQPTPPKNRTNWIWQSLLSFIALSGGYVLFKWLVQRNTQQTSLESTSYSEVDPNPAQLTQIIEDEVQVAKAILQATSRNDEIADKRFIISSDYFPVTKRQLKQSWRYLRRPVRAGVSTELDVKATVNQMGRQGFLLAPVLVPRRVNQSELLLLIDQDGSMIPFQGLSQRLATTTLRGGRLGKSAIYYFHNCPITYLYHDPYHQQAELVSDMINHVCSKRTAVLIFSDAGAARGGYSEERYNLTREFIAQLQQRVRYIAWLNPLPQKRWFGTTAGEIAQLVPMFEVSRRGVQDAIGVLRGRSSNFPR